MTKNTKPTDKQTRKKKKKIKRVVEPLSYLLPAEIQSEYLLIEESHNSAIKSLHDIQLPPLDKLKEDTKIKKLLATKEAIQTEIEKIYEECQACYKKNAYGPEGEEILKEKLSEASSDLSAKQEQIPLLDSQLHERLRKLKTETEDIAILEMTRDDLCHSLQADLTNYSSLISIIKIIDADTSADKVFFRSALIKEIKDLSRRLTSLGKSYDLNPYNIDTLTNRLLQHLGENPSIMPDGIFGLPQLPQEEIFGLVDAIFKDLDYYQKPQTSLVDYIFSTPKDMSGEQRISLKKRIIRMAELESHLKTTSFRIQACSDYFALREKEIALLKRENSLRDSLKAKIEAKLSLIESNKALMQEDQEYYAGTGYVLNEAEKTRQALENLKSQIEIDEASSLMKGQDKETEIMRLKKLKSSVQLKLVQIKRLKEVSGTFKDEAFQKKIEFTLNELKEQYEKNRREIKEQLDTAISHADAAFIAATLKHTSDSIKFQDYIENARQVKDDICEQLSEKFPLAELREKQSKALEELSDIEKAAREKIQAKYLTHVNRIESLNKQRGLPELNEINPFKTSVEALHAETLASSERLNIQYLVLANRRGLELEAWIEAFEAEKHHYYATLEKREIACQKAAIIEKRLNSKQYQLSIASIQKINKEIQRISEKHLDEAITHALTEDARKQLLAIKQAKYQIPSDITEETAEVIDLRLLPLLALRRSFEALNDELINTDLSKLNENQFLEKLIHIVSEQLQHNAEDYSNGRRQETLQWIRVHILKPMVTLQQQLIEQADYYWHPDKIAAYSPKFFPRLKETTLTPLATKTEKCLVNYSNYLVDELNSLVEKIERASPCA